MEITEENLKNPNRWSFDEAAVSELLRHPESQYPKSKVYTVTGPHLLSHEKRQLSAIPSIRHLQGSSDPIEKEGSLKNPIVY